MTKSGLAKTNADHTSKYWVPWEYRICNHMHDPPFIGICRRITPYNYSYRDWDSYNPSEINTLLYPLLYWQYSQLALSATWYSYSCASVGSSALSVSRRFLDRQFLDQQNLAINCFTDPEPSVPGSFSPDCTLPIFSGPGTDGPGSVVIPFRSVRKRHYISRIWT